MGILPIGIDAATSAEPRDAEALPLPAPSPVQRQAIQAAPEPLLVLAGPGAGKTFCLTERIRFLIEGLGFSPERVCAFTFTNKAAGEIAERLVGAIRHPRHAPRANEEGCCQREIPRYAALAPRAE